ncbi:uncharacterized protein LOC120542622 isoform X1 [Polypterus senegalus]|uniref:uncharacterized protein LOC120542622 isoform X1 n=2 Tax=Polypterus senegalus TaxID=55291 RepID=UPI001965E253|nr:uncharacterized protein LOC120542622 isoform X1 [Polypterus senegalus]
MFGLTAAVPEFPGTNFDLGKQNSLHAAFGFFKRTSRTDSKLVSLVTAGDDDPNTLRTEMSCGHATNPDSLTGWCRSLMDEGLYVFKCPALKDGTMQKCEAVWSYDEVRRLALLTDEEQADFEEKLAVMAAAEYCEFKQCPGCKTFVERKDLTNLSVHCIICTAQKGNSYDFCWQCLKVWKGPAPRSDRCDNEGCTNQELDALQSCPIISLPDTTIKDCPQIRACPTCGKLVEHNQKFCKNIRCRRCQVEFCFACLETKAVCKETGGEYYGLCAKPVAPRQMSIPVWSRRDT